MGIPPCYRRTVVPPPTLTQTPVVLYLFKIHMPNSCLKRNETLRDTKEVLSGSPDDSNHVSPMLPSEYPNYRDGSSHSFPFPQIKVDPFLTENCQIIMTRRADRNRNFKKFRFRANEADCVPLAANESDCVPLDR